MTDLSVERPAGSAKKLVLILALIFGLLAVCGLTGIWLRSYFAGQAIKSELAKAKAAGMLTTLEDVKRYVGPAPEENKNAASLYRKMADLKQKVDLAKVLALRKAFSSSPSGQTIAGAKQLLSENSELIALAEEAAKRPACYFDHDWTLGYSLLFKHLAITKSAAQLLLIRSQVAMFEKREEDALADLRRVRVLADHVAQDKPSISQLVSLAITELAVRVTTGYAVKLPPGSVWMNELALIEKGIRVPTYRDSAALDLFSDLMMFEDVKTPESREKRIGLKSSEEPPLETKLMAAAISQAGGVRNTISGRLKIWNELGKEDSIDWGVVAQGMTEVNSGYLSDPYLITTSQGLGIGDMEYLRVPRESAIERKLLIQAALRVLGQRDRTKLPSFSDLVSPADSMPMKGKIEGDKVILTFLDPIDSEDASRSLHLQLPQ